jgi:hypothetical protein
MPDDVKPAKRQPKVLSLYEPLEISLNLRLFQLGMNALKAAWQFL